MHVRQHIEDFVLTRISIGRRGEWLFKGEVLGAERRWFRQRAFFVDPDDGVLKDTALLSERLPIAQQAMKGEHA